MKEREDADLLRGAVVVGVGGAQSHYADSTGIQRPVRGLVVCMGRLVVVDAD